MKKRRGNIRKLATEIPDISASAQIPGAPTLPARVTLHPRFHSSFLPDDRDIMVYVPPQYEDQPDRHFPVLYLHDGQNLFDPSTSFVPGRTWRVAETADEAIEAGEVEPLIIVGIANTGDQRLAEYTPVPDWKMGGGEADKYGRLITEDLMLFINANYRGLRGRENTGMGGSSLGGLVTLYLGLKYQDLFSRLAVLSPSVWWNHKSIIGYVNDVRLDHKIWLTWHAGTRTLPTPICWSDGSRLMAGVGIRSPTSEDGEPTTRPHGAQRVGPMPPVPGLEPIHNF